MLTTTLLSQVTVQMATGKLRGWFVWVCLGARGNVNDFIPCYFKCELPMGQIKIKILDICLELIGDRDLRVVSKTIGSLLAGGDRVRKRSLKKHL